MGIFSRDSKKLELSDYSQKYNGYLLAAVEKVLHCPSNESLFLTMSLYPPHVFGRAVRLGHDMGLRVEHAAAFTAWFVSACFQANEASARVFLGNDRGRLKIYGEIDEYFRPMVFGRGAPDKSTYMEFVTQLRALTGW